MATQNDQFHEQFKNLYRAIIEKVRLIGEGHRDGGRTKMDWLPSSDEFYEKEKLKKAINDGALALPYSYQAAYVTPLTDNLDLVMRQTMPSELIENLVGAIYDHSDADIDSNDTQLCFQLEYFLAIVSNFTRSFLSSAARKRANLGEIKNGLPPLATFKYSNTYPATLPGPYILPADEIKLLFGGSVGIVVLPATYRSHPVLWAGLAHEIGGHDVLHADGTLLPELEEGIYRLFTEGNRGKKETRSLRFLSLLNQETRESIEFLGQLWRYWIGEAAADVYAILNMGPAFALNSAAYTAVFNKHLIPWIQGKLNDAKDHLNKRIHSGLLTDEQLGQVKKQSEELENRLKALADEDTEMTDVPILHVSPPDKKGNIDTHPSDVLRLYMMIGVIENLEGLKQSTKDEYVSKIEQAIQLCTTGRNNRTRKEENGVKIRGHLQISSDIWIEVPDEPNRNIPYSVPLYRMKEYARQVGRYVATEPLDAFKGLTIQDLVRWDNDHEDIAIKIRDRLIQDKASTPRSIDNIGDDAQLLAGSTLAVFEQPMLYSEINKRLAEALEQSFDRDAVWGIPGNALARAWSPSKNGSVPNQYA